MKKIEIIDEGSLAQILKDRRKELAVTQVQLAQYCDLSHNGISKIESKTSGDVKLSTLLKVSKILGFKIIIEMEE